LIFSELGWKSPFLGTDLEACPTPSPMMASGGDHGERSNGGSPHCDRRHPVEQGRTPPLLARHRRRPHELLLCASVCLGLLLCLDASFCSLNGVGFHVLHTWWPLSCKGSFLPGRGSWIVERVPSPCGRKDWRSLCTLGEVRKEHDASHARVNVV
jgi:hypothetical protein